jgi:poly [ADP-ribose] polymerase
LAGAADSFFHHYKDKTGVDWHSRFATSVFKCPANISNFQTNSSASAQKVVGKFYPVDVSASGSSAGNDSLESFGAAMSDGGSTSLNPRVAAVVKMIFNVDTMRSALLEMNIDSSKLPLGALSRDRLLQGCRVLSEIAALIEAGGERPQEAQEKMKLIDGSNHFFTIVPHSFGSKAVPVIDTAAQVQQHMKTMEALLEMETAAKIIQLEQPSSTGILDSCFAKLHIDMSHLAADSPTFKTLDLYLQRTLASTHKAKYDLAIVDAFAVSRHSECDRFEPWLDLHNHQLLWHGSRVSNFVGILSQGLRIAPPEAPVTGYMFGKVQARLSFAARAARLLCGRVYTLQTWPAKAPTIAPPHPNHQQVLMHLDGFETSCPRS